MPHEQHGGPEDGPDPGPWPGRALREVLDLVLPVTCAGCAAPGRALCLRCLHRWSGPPRRCEHVAGRLDRMDGTTLPVWALAVNDGTVRRAVGAWKDGGRADVTPWFAAVVERAGAVVERAAAAVGRQPYVPGAPGGEDVPADRRAPGGSGAPGGSRAPGDSGAPGDSLAPGDRGAPGGGGPSGRSLVVVPAPPSPAGLARRGEDLVATLAAALARGIDPDATRRAPRAGVPVRAVPVRAVPVRAVPDGPRRSGRVPEVRVERALRLAGRGRDQVGLGLRGRATNLAGRVRLRTRPGRSGAPGLRDADVLLVDDVLTTGATLAACRAAVESAGGRPVGAVVLAVTPPPGATPGWLEHPADQG